MGSQRSAERKLATVFECFQGRLTRLRPLQPGDLPSLQAWDSDPEIARHMGRQFVHETAQEWFRRTLTDRSYRVLAIETPEGTLIGQLEMAQINWRTRSGELRICIGCKEYWGAGYGSEALRNVLRVAFEVWGLQTVYLRVFVTNERAIRCYERCGFRREGLLTPSQRRGDPADVLLMTLSRQRWFRFHQPA